MAMEPMLTIRDSARATGLSVKALQRRIERGTLHAEMVDGKRRIALAELRRRQLLVAVAPEHPRTRVVDEQTAALIRRVASLERELHALRSEIARVQGEVSARQPELAGLAAAAGPHRELL